MSLDTFPSEEEERSHPSVLFDGSVAHSTLDDFPSEAPPRCKFDTAPHHPVEHVRFSEGASPAFAVAVRFGDSRQQLRALTRRLQHFLEIANDRGVVALNTARKRLAGIVSRRRWRTGARLAQFDRLAAKLRQG